MNPALSIPFEASVTASTRGEGLVASLRPFIDRVAQEQAATGDLPAAVRAAADAHPALADHFDLEPDRFGLGSVHLLPAADPVTEFRFTNHAAGRELTVEIEAPGDQQSIAALLRACSLRGAGKPRGQIESIDDQLLGALEEIRFLEPEPSYPTRFDHQGLPGVFRLQHACLLFRSLTTGVLIDPMFHGYTPPGLDTTIPVWDLDGQVDAVLISHSHGDHWNLAALLAFPRDTPIVVPHVPTPSVLCPDMAGQLRTAGFTRVIEARWFGPPIRIGDIEICSLPFYGEQPLLFERPRRSELRNWGNTYLVRTPQVSAWVLIDSGNDHLGRMTEVAEHVRAAHGSPDVVLSNLRPFAVGAGRSSPFYVQGNGEYWLSLAPEQMARFAAMNADIVTLGPLGVAEVCQAVGARAFLPYASWWLPLGQPDDDELRLCDQLGKGLTTLGAPTRIRQWTVGDGYVARRVGSFVTQRCLAARRPGGGR